MSTAANATAKGPSVEWDSLPYVEAMIGYCDEVDLAINDLAHPENTYIPITNHPAKIRDARPIRGGLDLDREGFVLVDHPTELARLRTTAELAEAGYLELLADVVRDLSGADRILPYRSHLQVRLSPRAPGENGSALTRPATYAHMDVTERMFHQWVEWAHEDSGLEMEEYSRVAVYQTWRAVSEPPHDFPMALTDGMSVKPGKFVVMDNRHGLGDGARYGENRLGVYDPDDKWFYFSRMNSDELLVFKAYDTDLGYNQNVLHTGFDNTHNVSNPSPRESIEARFVVCWR